MKTILYLRGLSYVWYTIQEFASADLARRYALEVSKVDTLTGIAFVRVDTHALTTLLGKQMDSALESWTRNLKPKEPKNGS